MMCLFSHAMEVQANISMNIQIFLKIGSLIKIKSMPLGKDTIEIIIMESRLEFSIRSPTKSLGDLLCSIL